VLSVAGLLRRRGGPLTDDLVRTRGDRDLGQVPVRLAPDGTATIVCGYCSTGCALDVHLKEGRAVNVTPSRSYPVNRGTACPKGWEALTPLAAPDRATSPLVRDGRGELVPVSWDEALRTMVSGFRRLLDEHGPEAVAFISTGQIPTEEMALLGAVAKFGMGMVHGDGNTRQCMATSVVAYKEAFGFDAPPFSYADLEESDVIVLWGANPCIAHPIIWERICRNRHEPAIVVVDPRTTETAMAATHHVALRPKSDLVLLYGVARALIARGAVDESFVANHTVGYEDFAAHVSAFTEERVAVETGLTVEAVDRLVDTIASGERVSFWWTMGVNQSHEGVRTAQAIIDLALLTGNIGRPGTGANSITGQCNAMGSRLFSNTTNLLGGHDFDDPADRAKVASILDIDEDRIPTRASDSYDRILEGIVSGRTRGLWVIATNTAHSWIDQSHTHELLDRLDLLVVQDMYATTETAQRAHVVLPAAAWGEKDGTFINSERRIGRVRPVAAAPGRALSDFEIFREVARVWGCAELFRGWSSPAAVFAIMQRLSEGQPCDITGIDGYDELDRRGGVQWPCPAGAGEAERATERRLFEDGRYFHGDGRARFVVGEPVPPPGPTTPRHPLVLLTGRGSVAEWHTGTRTSKSPLLRSLSPSEPYVEIHPDDADARGVGPGDRVVVESTRGSMRGRAMVTETVQPGQVFVSMHFAQANRLTFASFDPYSRQPAYKHAAVEVRQPEPWD
jgi:assimilatory nitrate reductase catalytic subunit